MTLSNSEHKRFIALLEKQAKPDRDVAVYLFRKKGVWYSGGAELNGHETRKVQEEILDLLHRTTVMSYFSRKRKG